MKKLDIIHNVIMAAFFLCLGAAVADIVLRTASEPTSHCQIADDYRSSLVRDIRKCQTEMCVVYFTDRASLAEEECSLDKAGGKGKILELPITEKY